MPGLRDGFLGFERIGMRVHGVASTSSEHDFWGSPGQIQELLATEPEITLPLFWQPRRRARPVAAKRPQRTAGTDLHNLA